MPGYRSQNSSLRPAKDFSTQRVLRTIYDKYIPFNVRPKRLIRFAPLAGKFCKLDYIILYYIILDYIIVYYYSQDISQNTSQDRPKIAQDGPKIAPRMPLSSFPLAFLLLPFSCPLLFLLPFLQLHSGEEYPKFLPLEIMNAFSKKNQIPFTKNTGKEHQKK